MNLSGVSEPRTRSAAALCRSTDGRSEKNRFHRSGRCGAAAVQRAAALPWLTAFRRSANRENERRFVLINNRPTREVSISLANSKLLRKFIWFMRFSRAPTNRSLIRQRTAPFNQIIYRPLRTTHLAPELSIVYVSQLHAWSRLAAKNRSRKRGDMNRWLDSVVSLKIRCEKSTSEVKSEVVVTRNNISLCRVIEEDYGSRGSGSIKMSPHTQLTFQTRVHRICKSEAGAAAVRSAINQHSNSRPEKLLHQSHVSKLFTDGNCKTPPHAAGDELIFELESLDNLASLMERVNVQFQICENAFYSCSNFQRR